MQTKLIYSLLFVAACTADNSDIGDGAVTIDLARNAIEAKDSGARAMDAGASADADRDMPPGPDMGCAPTSKPCGLCGTSFGTCVDGKLTFGPCMWEKQCAPGSKQTMGCDERVCDKGCKWQGWGPATGVQCADGTTQSCFAGVSCPHEGHNHCQPAPACKWGPCLCD